MKYSWKSKQHVAKRVHYYVYTKCVVHTSITLNFIFTVYTYFTRYFFFISFLRICMDTLFGRMYVRLNISYSFCYTLLISHYSKEVKKKNFFGNGAYREFDVCEYCKMYAYQNELIPIDTNTDRFETYQKTHTCKTFLFSFKNQLIVQMKINQTRLQICFAKYVRIEEKKYLHTLWEPDLCK